MSCDLLFCRNEKPIRPQTVFFFSFTHSGNKNFYLSLSVRECKHIHANVTVHFIVAHSTVLVSFGLSIFVTSLFYFDQKKMLCNNTYLFSKTSCHFALTLGIGCTLIIVRLIDLTTHPESQVLEFPNFRVSKKVFGIKYQDCIIWSPCSHFDSRTVILVI